MWNERPPGIFRVEMIIKLYEDDECENNEKMEEQIILFPFPPSWYKPPQCNIINDLNVKSL